MTTSSDMIAMLRRHYLPDGRPPGGIFAPEVQSPDVKRRADLLWWPLTASAVRGLVGHEVKVTRSDLISELRDPTKADPWLQFCSRWYLVVSDPKMIDGLEIPENWGVMAPPSGRRTRSMTILRPAPPLEPVDRMAAAVKIMAWQFWKRHDTEGALRHGLTRAEKRIELLEAQLRDREFAGATGATERSRNAVRVGRILHEAEKRLQQDHWAHQDIPDDDIVSALVDLGAIREAGVKMRRAIEDAVRAAEVAMAPMQRVAADLARVRSPLMDAVGDGRR